MTILGRVRSNKVAVSDPFGMSGFCRVARVSRAFGYVFANVPKSGGNSVRTALIRTEAYLSGTSEADVVDSAHMDSAYFYRFNTDHRMVTALSRGMRRGPLVTMVRNPFARALSAYHEKVVKTYRMLEGDPRYPMEKKGQRTRRLRELGLPLDHEVSFEEFLEGVMRVSPRWADQHFAPQSYLLAGTRVRYDCVGHLESYADDMDRISRVVFGDPGLWREAERAFGGQRNVNYRGGGAAERLQNEYTGRAIDLVRDYYADDFRLFGYHRSPARASEPPEGVGVVVPRRWAMPLALAMASTELAVKNVVWPGLRRVVRGAGS